MSAAADRAVVAVIGVGNPLAGDDGVGIHVVERLQARLPASGEVLWGTLQGDLLAVADFLPRASRFLFVDAVAGLPPGQVILNPGDGRAWAPSFHQTDLASTLRVLAAMKVMEPFPPCEIWGITIAPPEELGEGLSPAVASAAARLVEQLLSRVQSWLDVPPEGEA